MKRTLWTGGVITAGGGILLTLFLTWSHFNGAIGRLCGEGAGCESVLTSSLATVAGLPTALFGLLFYGTVLLGLLVYPLTHEQGRAFVLHTLLALTSVAFLLSSGLMIWSIQVLNTLCTYCSISFGLVTILFMGTLFWWIRGGRTGEFTLDSVTAWQGIAAGSAVLLLVGLLVIPSLSPDATTGSSTGGDNAEVRALAYDHHAVGSPDAPVRVVEFFDLGCPACQQFATQVFPRIKEEFIDTGEVLWTFRSFPLDQHHPNTLKAHSVLSAVPPTEYLRTKKHLMSNARLWSARYVEDPEPYLREVLSERGIEDFEFRGDVQEQLLDRRNAYAQLGIGQTPSFMVNGELVEGARPFSYWQQLLNQRIETARESGTGRR